MPCRDHKKAAVWLPFCGPMGTFYQVCGYGGMFPSESVAGAEGEGTAQHIGSEDIGRVQ